MPGSLIACSDYLLVEPVREPLDLDFVKLQRRFPSDELDTLFELWIRSARQHFESATGRQLMTATWAYSLDAFPAARGLELPHPPLQSVTSVEYDDGSGVMQALDPASYAVDAPSGLHPPRGTITLASGASWPTTAYQASKAVRITYIAGYGDDPLDVPDLIRQGLFLLVGHYHKFAEAVTNDPNNVVELPIGVDALLKDSKYWATPQLPPMTAAY